ncbi:hypothetical protein NL676_017439 [Syzygium grande]|nr:hypothetical protein NL676_017439 [Syzygium grande]
MAKAGGGGRSSTAGAVEISFRGSSTLERTKKVVEIEHMAFQYAQTNARGFTKQYTVKKRNETQREISLGKKRREEKGIGRAYSGQLLFSANVSAPPAPLADEEVLLAMEHNHFGRKCTTRGQLERPEGLGRRLEWGEHGCEFDGAKAYKDGRVCNILTVQEFHWRYHEETATTFTSLCPGCISTTRLFREHITLFGLLVPSRNTSPKNKSLKRRLENDLHRLPEMISTTAHSHGVVVGGHGAASEFWVAMGERR